MAKAEFKALSQIFVKNGIIPASRAFEAIAISSRTGGLFTKGVRPNKLSHVNRVLEEWVEYQRTFKSH